MSCSDYGATVIQRFSAHCALCYWTSRPKKTSEAAQWEANFHNTSDEHIHAVDHMRKLQAAREAATAKAENT